MKSQFIILLGLTVTSAAAIANDKATAEAAYMAREYSDAGIASAQRAADIYGTLAAQASGKAKFDLLSRQSESLYFVNDGKAYLLRLKWRAEGRNEEDISGAKGADKPIRDQVIQGHHQAVEIAGQVTAAYGADNLKVDKDGNGIPDSIKNLPEDEKDILVQAVYAKGINLAGEALATGKTSFLPQWGNLRNSMFLIIGLKRGHYSSYGPLRVLGRGFHKVPGIFGGSKELAEQYLREAFTKSIVPGTETSASGVVSLYLAEFLNENSKEEEAYNIAEKLVNADASKLDATLVPENKRAQQDAKFIFGI